MGASGGEARRAGVAIAGRDDRIGSRDEENTDRDVHDGLVVHDDHHALPGNGALHFEAHAAQRASESGGGNGVQAKPGAPDPQAVAREELEERRNQQPVSPRDDDEQVEGEGEQEDEAPRGTER